MILDSREKIEFYRSKMQELVSIFIFWIADIYIAHFGISASM